MKINIQQTGNLQELKHTIPKVKISVTQTINKTKTTHEEIIGISLTNQMIFIK